MNLTFYSFNNLHTDYPPANSVISTSDDGFPVIAFLRNSGWTDYGYVTEFVIYYYECRETQPERVGWSKIIQKDKNETELPNKFYELDKRFYSRFSPDFYEFLNKNHSKEKREILIKLRDINFDKKLEKELNSGKSKDLYEKYQKSILQEPFFVGFRG